MNSVFQSLLLVSAGSTPKELARQFKYMKVENEILRGKLPKRITVSDVAQTKCPLVVGQLQLSLQTASTAANLVQLAGLISAGPLRHTGTSTVRRAAQLIPGQPTDRRWLATLHDLSGEQRAEIWRQEQRVDLQPGDQLSHYASNESEAPAARPVNNRFPKRVLVSLIAPAAVAALAAYGLQLLRLSALQIGLVVGLLGLLGLI